MRFGESSLGGLLIANMPRDEIPGGGGKGGGGGFDPEKDWI